MPYLVEQKVEELVELVVVGTIHKYCHQDECMVIVVAAMLVVVVDAAEEVIAEDMVKVVNDTEQDNGAVGDSNDDHNYEIRHTVRAVVGMEVEMAVDVVAEAIQRHCHHGV